MGGNAAKAYFVVKPLKDVDQLMTMLEPTATSLLPLTPEIKTGWRSAAALVRLVDRSAAFPGLTRCFAVTMALLPAIAPL